MNKTVIFIVSAFVGGAAIGGIAGYFVGKSKASKETTKEEVKEETPKEDTKETTGASEDIQSYCEVIDTLEYRATNDDEEFTEEDQGELESLKIAEEISRYKAERKGLIEEITEDMYYSDSDETGDLILNYGQDDLYYFENQGVLITDLGELKYPIERYVGTILFDAANADEDEKKDKHYIRNHIDEMNYFVQVRDDNVEEYFPDLEY